MIRLYSIVLSFIFLCFCVCSYAQSNKNISGKSPIEYSLGYFGNSIWNPGLIGGIEYPLKSKTKTKKSGRDITWDFVVTHQLGFYWDPKSHVGAMVNNGIILRKTNSSNRQITYAFSPLNYHRSFLPETYNVDDSGNVSRLKFASRGNYAPSISIGIGKLKENKKTLAHHFKLHIMMLIPYNAGILPSLNLEYGYRFSRRKNDRV